MSNFFKDVLNDLDDLEQSVLGPDYSYYKQIKTPSEIGMSAHGSLDAMGRDIKGLISYVKLLVQGGGKASKVNGPLGNKFFLQTGAECKDINTGKQVNRSLYINNIPDGSIPFISYALDTKFNSFEGLIPGTFSNLGDINPLAIFKAFMTGTNPDCMKITMDTVDENNIHKKESKYVTISDIKGLDPCLFPDKKNPLTNKNCNTPREAFENIKKFKNLQNNVQVFNYIYFTILILFAIYVCYNKNKNYKS